MPRAVLVVALCVLAGLKVASAQQRVDQNVVYGMYSGLALLMDVYVPERPNGLGVIVIPGSGWQAALRYGADALIRKEPRNGVSFEMRHRCPGSRPETRRCC